MAKTVAVSTNRQYFDRFLQKHYTKPSKTLVHDPNETLVEGDVIEYGLFPPAERRERIEKGKGKRVKYVVRGVVTPFGVPLDQRVPRGGATPERLKS
jgi:ribosomal protein S17